MTTLAHAISYSLTAQHGLPHGLACALPLPHLFNINGIHAKNRVKLISSALDAGENIDMAYTKIIQFFESLDVSLKLKDYGIGNDCADNIIHSVLTSKRTRNNIVDLSDAELKNLVKGLF